MGINHKGGGAIGALFILNKIQDTRTLFTIPCRAKERDRV